MSYSPPYYNHCRDDRKELFRGASESMVEGFREANHQRSADTKREFAALRKALKKLTPYAREVLINREIDVWTEGRDVGAVAEMAYAATLKYDKFSAVDLLDNLLADEYVGEKSVRPIARRELIEGAALFFANHGGEVSSSLRGAFMDYMHQLFFDCGLEAADCHKAVQRHLKEHPDLRGNPPTKPGTKLTK
jgi:hypothetical protein